MKTSITSNFRPLLRAFYAFLIVIAVLWVMPRNAHAQLYVTQTSSSIGTVSEYDATTGKAINANFIRGLNEPSALAVLGTELFVATFLGNEVGKYNATTGAAINAHFITGAEYENGQWHEAKLINLDPQRPPKAYGVETIDLLNWLSPTTIQIREHYHVMVSGKGWEWQEHVTSLEFKGGNVLAYAAK